MLFFRQREHRVTLSSSDLGDEEGLLESQFCSLTEEAHLTWCCPESTPPAAPVSRLSKVATLLAVACTTFNLVYPPQYHVSCTESQTWRLSLVQISSLGSKESTLPSTLSQRSRYQHLQGSLPPSIATDRTLSTLPILVAGPRRRPTRLVSSRALAAP